MAGGSRSRVYYWLGLCQTSLDTEIDTVIILQLGWPCGRSDGSRLSWPACCFTLWPFAARITVIRGSTKGYIMSASSLTMLITLMLRFTFHLFGGCASRTGAAH